MCAKNNSISVYVFIYLVRQSGHNPVSWSLRNRHHYLVHVLTLRLKNKI